MNKKNMFIVMAVLVAGIVVMADSSQKEKSQTAAVKIKELPPVAPARNEAFFGARIQRTMTLLETSNKKHHNRVKILFYGQSIVASSWSHTLAAKLKERYPEADLTIENRAIGGYTAPALRHTALLDLYPYYPDLVVFHVYGGAFSGELESIISNVRRFTTAEIMIFTNHIRPKQMENDDIDNNALVYLAQKYNCELVNLREEWQQYVTSNNIDPDIFLVDGTHPNAKGNNLFVALGERHFKFNSLFPCGWTDTVRTYNVNRFVDEGFADEIVFTGKPWIRGKKGGIGISPNSALKLTFVGNRLDVIAGKSKNKLGTATVLIDGKAPSSYLATSTFTGTSKAYKSWMPAISYISHNVPLIPEDWKLRVLKTNDKSTRFTFEVIGSVTGPDGIGTNNADFISKSGRVVIKKSDNRMSQIAYQFQKPFPEGFEVTWKVLPLYVDTYHPPVIKDDTKVYQTTLVQGISNTRHTLEIIPNGDGDIPITEIQTYSPPLH